MKFECVFCCCSVIPSSIGEGLILFLIIWVTFSYTQQNMQNGRWRCSKKKNKHIILIMPTARSSKAMVIWILNSEHRVINMIRVEKIILICVCRRFLSIFTKGSNHEKKKKPSNLECKLKCGAGAADRYEWMEKPNGLWLRVQSTTFIAITFLLQIETIKAYEHMFTIAEYVF